MPLSQTIQENGQIDLPPGYTVLQGLPYPMVLMDRKGAILWANHQAESLFQSSQNLMQGADLGEFLEPDCPVFGLLRRAVETGGSVSDQGITLISQRIGRHLVDAQISPVEARNPGWCLSIQERTLARQVRGQSAFKGAALSMSKMTALLAHEIKNPLAGIRGAAQLLEEDLATGGHELCEMIVSETDRITALLSRIEGLASDAPLQLAKVNIHEVLDHCVKLTRASFGRHLTIIQQFDPSLPLIRADKELLIQAFINIFKNASEATENDDKLIIKTSYSITGWRTRNTARNSSFQPLQIDITDTGSGIPEELQDLVFEPFISSKSGGSGLGLALVASVVADHGGVVRIDSNSGGTHLQINLPLRSSAASPTSSKEPQSAEVAHKERASKKSVSKKLGGSKPASEAGS